MQLKKSVRLYFLISVWKNIWLTCSHRVKPCVVCFQISYLDWWIVAIKCIFSQLCISKCVFRCKVWLNVLSHCIVHICGSSLRCEWAGASSDLRLYWMICCNLDKDASLPHCVSASESSDVQQVSMICCIQHICVTSPRCEWACESSDLQLDWMICYILSICVTSLLCESTYGWPVGWNIWMTWHTCCKDMSLLCPRSDLFSSYCLLTMTEESLSPLFIWSVRPLKKSTMYHLHHDSVFVRLFFTVWFIKSSQIAKNMLFFKIL